MDNIQTKKKTPARTAERNLTARDRIKPRGLWGLYEGKIHYNEDEDIFNLGLRDRWPETVMPRKSLQTNNSVTI